MQGLRFKKFIVCQVLIVLALIFASGYSLGAEDLQQAGKVKAPDSWGEGIPNKKGVGFRWQDPENPGNGIRVDQGNPQHSFPSQQVDHVIVRRNGQVIGRNGNPINGSIKSDPNNAHIPLGEWKNWSSWYSP
jgi:hypothetical protein